MVKFIKKILYRLIPLSLYLKALHIGFVILFKSGYLKNNYIYKYHYFVKNLIKKGDLIIDLGANLGYYSRIFSDLCGKEGKVISIEPVSPFFKTLSWALSFRSNCLLYNYALGSESKNIQMSFPKEKNNYNSGLASILNSNEDDKNYYQFEVKMIEGSHFLSNLDKIDYIKCDIEGYEAIVIPNIMEIIKLHKPIIQIETCGSNKDLISNLLVESDYLEYSLYNGKLINYPPTEFGDYIYIHKTKFNQVNQSLF